MTIVDASLPMPIQIVLDDVGWWSGRDGHEQQQPFRTGIDRDHTPADYEALAMLGRKLGMRPQAAMILCEWDVDNLLRSSPNSQWMGDQWDNAKWVGPWLDEAAAILRDEASHVEITLHGLGHEYWDDAGKMSRAEWHDMEGRMRPRAHVRRTLDLYSQLLDRHQLGAFPESFVPCAFRHRFGAGDEGIAPMLRDAGVRYISSPFAAMYDDRPPMDAMIDIDEGVVTIDRGGIDTPWFAIDCHPEGDFADPILGLHWPNILHTDPSRNEEVVDRWVAWLKPFGQRFDRMLAPDTKTCWTQVGHVRLVDLCCVDGRVTLDFKRFEAMSSYLGRKLTIKLRVAADSKAVAKASVSDFHVTGGKVLACTPADDGALVIELERDAGAPKMDISFQS